MKKFKLVVPSFVALIFCMLLIAGSTFALFTSQASADISVTSGKVKVAARLDGLQAYSAQPNDEISTTADGYAGEASAFGVTSKYEYILRETAITNGFEFANGGGVTLESNELSLVKVTPGDKAVVTLNLDNSSNVNIKYRVRYNAISDNGLLSGLKVKVLTPQDTNPVTYSEEVLNGVIKVGKWANWNAPSTETETKTLKLVVELPIDAGNEYQSKNASLRFTVEAVQGNAKVDTLLEEVNDHLAESTHNTMYDAKIDAEAFRPEFDASKYLWNMDTDQFYDPSNLVSGFEDRYFKYYTEMPVTQTYSIYAGDDWALAEVTDLTVGFDAGETTGITLVEYDRNNESSSKEVIIRTNSSSTSLIVNAENDVIYRYGNVGAVTINAVAGNSYHEYGKAEYVEIAKGRIALEAGSSVKTIHLIANEDANGFEPIVVSKESTVEMPDFSRDPVTIASTGTLVVELQNDTNNDENTESDYVWLTAVGIFEQVTLGTAEEAGNQYAVDADPTAKDVQRTAAQQIANNISTTIENEEYSVHAEKDSQTGEWTYTLKDSQNVAATYEVSAVEVTTTKTQEVVTSSATVTVVSATTEATTINNNTNNTASAKEKAINDVIDGAVVYNSTSGTYYAVGTGKTYETAHAAFEAAINAANAYDTLVVLKNITFSDVLTIEGKKIKIVGDGTGHTLTGASNQNSQDGRAINIFGDNSNVTLKNITIVGPTSGAYTRGLNIANENVTVKLENCTITCNNYAINITKGHNTPNRGYSNNLTLIVKDSTIRGWAAINHHGSSGNISIENSTLVGINNNSGVSNAFATIVIDGNAFLDSTATVSDNNVSISNSVIVAQQNGDQPQRWISFQYGAQNNSATVSVDSNTRILDSEEENANDKVTTFYMSGLGNVITVPLTSTQKAELLAKDFAVTDNANGTSSITLPLPNVWYSNGAATYQNNDLSLVNPSSVYLPINTIFATPFKQGWIADGEGIKLTDNVALNYNVTLNMTSGSIYLILGNYSISGTGKLVLQGVAKVISDKGDLAGLFASEDVKVTNNNNGTYTYYLDNDFTQLYNQLVAQNATIDYMDASSGVIYATLSDNVMYHFDTDGCVGIVDASGYNGYYGEETLDPSTYYVGRLVPVNYLFQATDFNESITKIVFDRQVLNAYKFLEGNTTVETIEFGPNVTKVLDRFVYRCHVSNVIMTDSITTIDNRAFYDNAYIENIVIPASVTTIGSEAFSYMTSLKTLTIKGSPTIDVYYMGRSCNQLTDVWFEGENTVFTNSKINSQTFTREESGQAYPIVIHFATQEMLEAFTPLNGSSDGLSFEVIE